MLDLRALRRQRRLRVSAQVRLKAAADERRRNKRGGRYIAQQIRLALASANLPADIHGRNAYVLGWLLGCTELHGELKESLYRGLR